MILWPCLCMGQSNNISKVSQKTLQWSLLPGGGQWYNQSLASNQLQMKHHSWWKLPILYSGFGTMTYYAYQNYHQARLRKLEWRERLNASIGAENPHLDQFKGVETVTLQSQYRDFAKKRNILYTGIVAIYLFSIAEAYLSNLNLQQRINKTSAISYIPTVFEGKYPGLRIGFQF